MASKGHVEFGVRWGLRVAARDPYWPLDVAVDDALAIRRLARVAGQDRAARVELAARADKYGATVAYSDRGTVLRWGDGRDIEVPT